VPADAETQSIARPAFDFFEGYMVTSVLASFEIGGFLEVLVSDGLDPRSGRAGEDAALLEAALRYLARRGLVEETGGVFELTGFGRVVCEDKGYLVWLGGGYSEPLRHLANFLRGEMQYGVDRTRDGRWVAAGAALLGRQDVVPEALELLAEASFARVLDLGCGNARFLISVCDRFDADGVGVDLSPGACDAAAEAIDAANMGERVEVVLGDATDLDSIPHLGQTELVIAFFLLHEISSQSRDTLITYLSDLASRLPAGASLLTAEVEPAGEGSGTQPFTPEFDFVHAMMKQSLLPEQEWRSAFAESGFEVTNVVRPAMPGGLLLLARKSG
jgi:2-ketoarginine methyltransferase